MERTGENEDQKNRSMELFADRAPLLMRSRFHQSTAAVAGPIDIGFNRVQRRPNECLAICGSAATGLRIAAGTPTCDARSNDTDAFAGIAAQY